MAEYTGGKCKLSHKEVSALSEEAVGGKTGGSAKPKNIEGKTIAKSYSTKNPQDFGTGSVSAKNGIVTGAKIGKL